MGEKNNIGISIQDANVLHSCGTQFSSTHCSSENKHVDELSHNFDELRWRLAKKRTIFNISQVQLVDGCKHLI